MSLLCQVSFPYSQFEIMVNKLMVIENLENNGNRQFKIMLNKFEI